MYLINCKRETVGIPGNYGYEHYNCDNPDLSQPPLFVSPKVLESGPLVAVKCGEPFKSRGDTAPMGPFRVDKESK